MLIKSATVNNCKGDHLLENQKNKYKFCVVVNGSTANKISKMKENINNRLQLLSRQLNYALNTQKKNNAVTSERREG